VGIAISYEIRKDCAGSISNLAIPSASISLSPSSHGTSCGLPPRPISDGPYLEPKRKTNVILLEFMILLNIVL